MSTFAKLVHILYAFATLPDVQATFKELAALLGQAHAADAAANANAPNAPAPPAG